MEAQGYPIKRNILYQDNKSAILLETNGKKELEQKNKTLEHQIFLQDGSSGKRKC